MICRAARSRKFKALVQLPQSDDVNRMRKVVTVPGQPYMGFHTYAECFMWLARTYASPEAVVQHVLSLGRKGTLFQPSLQEPCIDPIHW